MASAAAPAVRTHTTMGALFTKGMIMPMNVIGMATSSPQPEASGIRLPMSNPTRHQSCQFRYIASEDPSWYQCRVPAGSGRP